MVIQICLENNHLGCFYLFWIFFYSDGEVRGLGCLGTISLCFLILQYISLFDLIFFYSGGVMVQICGKRLDLVQKKKLFLEGHEDSAVVIHTHFYCLCFKRGQFLGSEWCNYKECTCRFSSNSCIIINRVTVESSSSLAKGF